MLKQKEDGFDKNWSKSKTENKFRKLVEILIED